MIEKSDNSSTAPSPEDILKAVMEERTRQDAQWGGPDHDDSHPLKDWATFISKQTKPIREIEAFSISNSEDFEERMVKVAALAFAAIRSNRRRLLKHYDVA